MNLSREHTRPSANSERTNSRHVLPLVVLAFGIGFAFFLKNTKPQGQVAHDPIMPPAVQVLSVAPTTASIPIESFGSVFPRTTFSLVSEVAGRVTWVAPELLTGGILRKGETIARIDDTEYALEVAKAKAELEAAKLELTKVEAQAQLSKEEWRTHQKGPAPVFVRKEPELAAARSKMVAADASYKLAKLQLERTAIRSPLDARSRKGHIDLGLYVDKGATVAELYSIDIARVRFPLNRTQLELLDLPPLPAPLEDGVTHAPVTIIPQPEKSDCSWKGSLVTTEGEVDPNSHTIYGIVDVEQPYRVPNSDCLPLFGGSFVRIALESRVYTDIFRVPSQALHGGKHIFTVDDENHLRLVEVKVIYDDGESAVIGDGLDPGLPIVTSTTAFPVPGMQVAPTPIQEEP